MRYAAPPEDETSITRRWSELAALHSIDLVVCVSAAQRRGLLTTEEAAHAGPQGNDVAAGFRISGLGQWAEAVLEADRVIIFG